MQTASQLTAFSIFNRMFCEATGFRNVTFVWRGKKKKDIAGVQGHWLLLESFVGTMCFISRIAWMEQTLG